MTDALVVVGVVLGVNLLPAFGPPTWLVLVLLRLELGIGLVPLVLLGAASATAGRVLLALGTRGAGRWLPRERTERLEAAGALVRSHRGRAVAGLGLFLLSPLPSAQLFEAAGLMRLALGRLAVAFLAGRLASYSLYAGAATAAGESFGRAFRDSVTSWPGLLLQGGLLVAIWALSRVDWVSRAGTAEGSPGEQAPAGSAPVDLALTNAPVSPDQYRPSRHLAPPPSASREPRDGAGGAGAGAPSKDLLPSSNDGDQGPGARWRSAGAPPAQRVQGQVRRCAVPELPHDVDDLRLAPLVLHLEDRLVELGGLDAEEMRLRVALDANTSGLDSEHRADAMLRVIARDIPLGAWQLAWNERGLEVSHGVHSVVLGVPRSVDDYVRGPGTSGRPNR